VSFLLDINAISEIRRGRDQHVQAWASAVSAGDLYLSVLTIGEIRKGIERLRARDLLQAQTFATWLAELEHRFAQRILNIDARIAQEWGRLNALTPHNTVDSLIAATALVHGLTVVTRNTADFQGCEVALLNPWEYQPPSPA
jgi:predicted nucleic acid-binding protein